ncbi:hypothetical protein KR044_003534 [Drosophila immigrans]|nr:hypothetical protein KR044_003534 [Drosophila immigrans]
MLAISFLKRGFFLLLLLLLLNNSLMLETESQQINYLKNVVQNVLKEKSADTLLLLQRRQDLKCPLKDLNIDGMPILRMDESTVVPIKYTFNCQVIAVVCMSEVADSMLLTALAKDLDRMREARIIIWLQSPQSNLIDVLNAIRDYASNNNFLNLIVLHSKYPIAAYRLQPFPNATLERVVNIFTSPIFRDLWRNFRNKTATIVPSLYPPSSFIGKNRKSGKLQLTGHMDILMLEFARKYNINLKLPRPLSELENVDSKGIVDLALYKQADLTMSVQMWRSDVESSHYIDISHQFIIVPCGKAIGIGDVYKSLKIFLLIILGVYLIISVVTTLLEAATCRIFGRRYRFSYGNVFVNLNAFRWVLGLSSDVNRDRRSTSLHQIIMVMSIFSLIVICFFNANLSTFLTKRPQHDNIKNFQELKESGLPVVYDDVLENWLENIKEEVGIAESQILFVPNKVRIRMILALNTSNAYHTFDKLWYAINEYQMIYKRIALCRSHGLHIAGTFPNHAILQPNSIYREALNDYILWICDLGLSQHWIAYSINKLVAFTNRSQEYPHPTPLKYDDLKWVWNLLGLCYIASILVFIGELTFHRWQIRREARFPFVI